MTTGPMIEAVDATTKRRVILVECTLPASRWSSRELEQALSVIPILDCRVYGELDVGCLSACRQKINQATREVEAPYGDIQPSVLHTLYKAGSFFRDIFPDKFWKRDKMEVE